MLVSLLCLFVYLVASFPLLWLVWMQPCGWGHILVMLACLPLSFLSLVCLCMLEFLMIALYMPYNMIIFILVWQHALPLLCLLALCYLVCFPCFCLHFCLHVHACVFVFLLYHQASFLPMISCRFTLVFVHEIPGPFLGTLLDGISVVCAPI